MSMKRVCLIILLALVFSISACTEGGIFPDPNLDALVRKAIDKPEGAILPSELEGLTSLEASERGITDLNGLEYCTNLTDLNLWDNRIRDISPLASLTNLTHLIVGHNQISDISSLMGPRPTGSSQPCGESSEHRVSECPYSSARGKRGKYPSLAIVPNVSRSWW